MYQSEDADHLIISRHISSHMTPLSLYLRGIPCGKRMVFIEGQPSRAMGYQKYTNGDSFFVFRKQARSHKRFWWCSHRGRNSGFINVLVVIFLQEVWSCQCLLVSPFFFPKVFLFFSLFPPSLQDYERVDLMFVTSPLTLPGLLSNVRQADGLFII